MWLIFPWAAEWFYTSKGLATGTAFNSNSTCCLGLHMHCWTAREGGKQAAHETHEAWSHRLIPCNIFVGKGLLKIPFKV